MLPVWSYSPEQVVCPTRQKDQVSYFVIETVIRSCIICHFILQTPNTKDADENGLDEACGGVSVPDEDTEDALVNGIPIEESLFEDDIDDLELEDLEIVD